MPWLLFGLVAALWFWRSRSSGSTSDSGSTVVSGGAPASSGDSIGAISDMTDMGSELQSVIDLGHAIAHAEGYGLMGAIPTRANNPGDLVIPGWTGPTLGDQNISVFASPNEGWTRLYHELDLIRGNKSDVYTPDMSISDVGAKWAGVSAGPTWATNVATYLQNLGYNVDESSALSDFLI